MASPEELAIIDAATPASVPTVTLSRGDEKIAVPETERFNYLAQGYEDTRFVEGGEFNPTLSGVTDNILARGEALDRGATGGLAGLAGSAISAGVDQLMPAGGEIGQAAGPSLDAAPVDKSFGASFHEAEQARRQRAEALGAEGLAWEAAGGLATLGAGAMAKGGSLGAKALLMGGANPVALAEKLGTKAAATVLGEQAAAGILKTVGARAVGGLAEGAVSGAAQSAIENVDLTLENPVEAAENIALGAGFGGGLGAVLGGGFGLVEGVGRAVGNYVPGVMQAADPAPAVPAPRDVSVDETLLANQTRPLTSAQLPDPHRGFLRSLADQHDALVRGEADAIEQGAREASGLLDQSELLNMEMRTEAGIAQKQLVNDIALQSGFADDVVERFDPDDLRMADDLRTQRDFVSGQRSAAQAQFDDLTLRHQDAISAEATARKALDDAMSPVDDRVRWAAEQESAAQRALEASPDDPALRDAFADAQKARVDAESTAKPRKPSATELAPLKQQLKDAQRELKTLSKDFEAAKATYGKLDTDFVGVNDAALNAPPPRRMTRLESESRDMYQGVLKGIDDAIQKEGVGTGPGYQNLANFRSRVENHLKATVEAFKRGDFGDAHNLMDQGLKDSIDDFITRAQGDGTLQRFGNELYKVPQSFLENANVWGPDIAGRNAMANPAWHKGIVASNDAGFRSLYTTVGEEGYLGRGNRRGANSAAVSAVMKQLGEQPVETTEAGIRNALRARNEDFLARANAWGTDRAKEIAARHVKLQTHLEDIMDNTALVRRDAAKARQGAVVAKELLGPLAGPAAASVKLPVAAGRWFVNTVGRYKGDMIKKMADGAAKLVHAGRSQAVQSAARKMTADQRREALTAGGTSREQRIAEAKERLDIASPKLRSLVTEGLRTDALSPGLGTALVQQQLRVDQYILSKLPQPPSPTVFSPPARLTAAAATSLDRILIATNNPIKTVDRIMGGEGTPEDLDAVRTLYPEVYKKMTDSIMSEIQHNPKRVRSASVQMYLSRVVGQPLTPALLRIGQAQDRARKATQQAEEAGKPMDGGDGVTSRAPIQLSTNPDEVYGTRSDRLLSQ